jgi:hypothetical protein
VFRHALYSAQALWKSRYWMALGGRIFCDLIAFSQFKAFAIELFGGLKVNKVQHA